MSSTSGPDVAELLRRARAGDEAARNELFGRCRNYVAVVARTQVESWMRRRIDGSDIVQQTLLEAHRGWDRFAGETEAEWLAWLRQILTHNTQDFVRRCRTEKRAVGREIPLQQNSDSSDGTAVGDPADRQTQTPSQVLHEHEREIELADAIAQLSPDHQEVVLLRNLQRLPFDEVARQMGRSRPAVQMLWMRAIRRLEELLRERGVE